MPKEHFDNIYELDDDTAAHVFKVATKISKAYKKALDFDGLNIVQNNGEVAGQTVFHFICILFQELKVIQLRLAGFRELRTMQL